MFRAGRLSISIFGHTGAVDPSISRQSWRLCNVLFAVSSDGPMIR